MPTLINKITPLVVAGLIFTGPVAIADQVIQDDLVVVGSICAGFDCVNGESFGFDTLRLKENNLRIKFQDTSSSSSFPSGDWQLTINDSVNGGANWIGFEDIDSGRTPFTILQGAPNYSIYVSSNGNVGMGTTTPLVDLVIKQGNTPTVRLEQDGSSGFAAQTWDMGGNEANFFIRDVTNGSKLPFRIVPSAPNASIYVAADGDIGFETTTPDGLFDVAHSGDANNHALLIGTDSYVGINIDNGQIPKGWLDVQTSGGNSRLTVSAAGDVGLSAFSPSGRFDVRALDGTTSYFNVDASGDVGIGTFSPVGRFEVKSTDGANSYFNIDASGYVGIGGNSTLYYGIQANLDIRGATSLDSIIGINVPDATKTSSIAFTQGSGRKWLMSSRHNLNLRVGSTIDRFALFDTGDREVFTVHQGGNIFIGGRSSTNNNTAHPLEAASGAHLTSGGVWTSISSRSAKDNIVDLGLEEANQALAELNPVTFNYIREPEETYAGFIAEDVPELVATNDRKGLTSMDIVAVLTKIVQAQQKTINDLSSRLVQLEKNKVE